MTLTNKDPYLQTVMTFAKSAGASAGKKIGIFFSLFVVQPNLIKQQLGH